MKIDYDEEEEFDRVLTSTTYLLLQYYDKYIYKRPCTTSTQTGNKWIKEILEGNNSRCCSMFMMEKDVFKRLYYNLETNYGLCASRRISAAKMLAMFLFVLGGENSNKSTKERFQHFGETISQKFEEVLRAVCKMAIDIIQPKDRDFKEVPTKLRNDDRYWPHFKDAIGAIDGTHVPMIASTDDQIQFIGRKGISTQNIDVQLEEEDEDDDEGEAENGVEKVGDEFLGTMEMVQNNIASSLIGGRN
ncbi:uncharacterized protein LOC130939786 [Arachis stenosperma]|uniref:uncharacterized protein LOC130939786 n=1 Tax=Arachis stenosperma TaxID=217475 RepID=UPI0025AD883C|nr:uncharacterized protein LOC130939786 [Arachis stenosperma]